MLALFANPSSLNTLQLDINRQIDSRNAGLDRARQAKLAACPAWVRANLGAVEKVVGDLVVKSQLQKFTPDPKASGVITDGSYGTLVNNKLKRQVTSVVFEGNFQQTQSILRSIERLQPLLVFKNVEFVVGDGTPGRFNLTSCLRPREILSDFYQTVSLNPKLQPHSSWKPYRL